MFDGLTERLSTVFDRLSGRCVLSEKDVDEALREVRVALLEADVALPVVRDFIAKAKQEAAGEAVIRSIRPADQVVKIVYDGLVEMLGGDEPEDLNLTTTPPTVILMAGLQGSGKTTTAAKLALRRKGALMRSRGCERQGSGFRRQSLSTPTSWPGLSRPSMRMPPRALPRPFANGAAMGGRDKPGQDVGWLARPLTSWSAPCDLGTMLRQARR